MFTGREWQKLEEATGLDSRATQRPFCKDQRHGLHWRKEIGGIHGVEMCAYQSREGVERNKSMNVEAMYVDIIKNREEGSSTNYDDHALTNDVFQWDTHNKVSPDSPIGQNYIHQRQNTLLFVRQQSEFPEDKNRTMGYVYLGKTTTTSVIRCSMSSHE